MKLERMLIIIKRVIRYLEPPGFGFGANAEYISLPARPDDAQGVLVIKPSSITYEEAAILPTAGFEALHYIRNSNIQAGSHVLIIGGGGSIGTLAIQLAKLHEAEVTAVDSTDKQALLRSLGADHTIDYTTTDYLKQNNKFDMIIDVVGRKSVRRRLRLLKPGGSYYLAFARPVQLFLALWTSLTGQKKINHPIGKPKEGRSGISYQSPRGRQA